MTKRPRLARALPLTFKAFNHHNASRFGAALAFYIVFSIVPILLIAIAVAGNLFGRREAERELLEWLGGSFGSAAAVAVGAMIKDAARGPIGWLATALALSSLYFGLSGVYRQIDDALHTIWPSKEEKDVTRMRAFEKKVTSMLLVFAACVVVLLSIIADAVIAATGKYAGTRLIGGEVLWHALQLVVSTAVLTGLFAAVLRYLPQARVTWREVRLGAAVTAFLFVIGKFGLGFYLGKAAVGSAFGAAGSIVVVLLWSYWSAQIFFFGLEFTHVYAQERE